MPLNSSPEQLPEALREQYQANVRALANHDPELADRIEALPMCDVADLERTRDENWTTQVESDDGKRVYVHSRYRPGAEAASLIDQQARASSDTKRSVEAPLDDVGCFLIHGSGLGYVVTELERRYHDPLLIVAEEDLALLKLALCVTDFTRALGAGRLFFFTAPDKSELHARLRPAIANVLIGLRILRHAYTGRVRTTFHRTVGELMRDFIAFSRVQMVSLLRHSRTTCENVAYNLGTYVERPGIEVLAGRGKGHPAVLVAAGPSLARNLDLLAELRDRAIIIAVQTVLKTLLACGIRPHFVTSLDYHEISAQFFEGISDFHDTILVAEPKVAWHVIDVFDGRTHVLRSEFAEDLLQDVAPSRAGLRAGSTVAHLSLYLAEHLGCDPIMLLGQDLSFSDGLYYPPGVQIERIWQPELGRFQTVEMKQWERIVRSRVNLRTVEDVHGRKVYTDDQMFTYAEQFEADIAASAAQIVQAGEGGRRLRGVEVTPFADFVVDECSKPLPADLFALPGAVETRTRADARTALETRIEEVRQMRAIVTESLELLEWLDTALANPREFNKLVPKIHKLRDRMQTNRRTYSLVSSVSQSAELKRFQADRGIRDDEAETPETARRRLRRDREYVAAFGEGCDYLLRMLPEAIARLGGDES